MSPEGQCHNDDNRRSSHVRRFVAISPSQCLRYHRGGGYGQTDGDGCGEEDQRSGIADSCGELLLAEQGNIEKIQRIYDEDGDKANGARACHYHHMAHDGAGDELRRSWRHLHPLRWERILPLR